MSVTQIKHGEIGLLKSMVKTYYGMQKQRIAMGNQLCAHFKTKLGIKPSTPESEAGEEVDNVLAELRTHWDLLSEAFCTAEGYLKSRYKPEGIFTSKAEVVMTHQFLDFIEKEKAFLASFESVLETFPVYTSFLKEVKGCGPLISAVLLADLDPYKADYPSQFHAYAGLDVVMVPQEDGTVKGEGRGRYKHHLVGRSMMKDGQEVTYNGLSHNLFLKTKLVGVMMISVVKAVNRNSHKGDPIEIRYAGNTYAQVLLNYKNRLENDPRHQAKTPAHRQRMAFRYAAKIFLIDFWKAYRTQEGLPICPSYAEGKLGIVHGKGSSDARSQASVPA